MSHCGTSTFDNHLDFRLIVLKDIQDSRILCIGFGGLSIFVGMTLVCLIGMVLCMFDLTTADGYPRGSLLGPSVLFGTE